MKALNTPVKIQDFLNRLPMNFEDIYLSPRRVLRERRAQCLEGALLAALAMRLAGRKPLIVDMKSFSGDDDHVIAVFQEGKHWGAISKTNHGTLRYREPIYANIRELVMSYFHEYILDDGRKTLRSYTNPIHLSVLDRRGWMTSEEGLSYMSGFLNRMPHIPLLSRSQIARLRKAEPIERLVGKIVEWTKDGKKKLS